MYFVLLVFIFLIQKKNVFNEDRTQCVIYNVLNQKNIMRSFIIETFEKSIEKICKVINCLNSFFPINDSKNNDIYYLSFKYLNFLKTQNFIFNDNKKKMIMDIFSMQKIII